MPERFVVNAFDGMWRNDPCNSLGNNKYFNVGKQVCIEKCLLFRIAKNIEQHYDCNCQTPRNEISPWAESDYAMSDSPVGTNQRSYGLLSISMGQDTAKVRLLGVRFLRVSFHCEHDSAESDTSESEFSVTRIPRSQIPQCGQDIMESNSSGVRLRNLPDTAKLDFAVTRTPQSKIPYSRQDTNYRVRIC